MPGGGGTAEKTRALGPLCWGIDVGDFAAWLRTARAGDVIRYAGGPTLPRSMPIVSAVARALAAGQVRTHQPREDGTIIYYAVRRSEGEDRDGAGADSGTAPDPDSPGGRMLALIDRTAREGRPCPSNAVMAIALGLKGKEQARYVLGQLLDGGHVRVRNRGPKLRRIVTVTASGLSTAAWGAAERRDAKSTARGEG